VIARLFRIIGIVLLASGLLFLLQGAGLVHWPPESFMLDQRVWVRNGLAIALAGACLIFLSRRL
jgi:hypothetical protein